MRINGLNGDEKNGKLNRMKKNRINNIKKDN